MSGLSEACSLFRPAGGGLEWRGVALVKTGAPWVSAADLSAAWSGGSSLLHGAPAAGAVVGDDLFELCR